MQVIITRIQNEEKGINPLIKNRFFNKYTTSSEKGSGFGLYISKNIIESQGGKIWIEDRAKRWKNCVKYTV